MVLLGSSFVIFKQFASMSRNTHIPYVWLVERAKKISKTVELPDVESLYGNGVDDERFVREVVGKLRASEELILDLYRSSRAILLVNNVMEFTSAMADSLDGLVRSGSYKMPEL